MNSTGELNLYLDLLAFSELTTEEQLAYKERLKLVSSEEILETEGEFPGFVEAIDSSEEVLSPNESSEPVFEFMPDYEPPPTVEAALESLPAEKPQPSVAPVAPGEQLRESGPLSITGFLFDPASKAAPQLMLLAVCATCGSETDDGDLFCAECGAFMDEKGYAEVSGAACDDCGLIVNAGELICPACGSVSMVC